MLSGLQAQLLKESCSEKKNKDAHGNVWKIWMSVRYDMILYECTNRTWVWVSKHVEK